MNTPYNFPPWVPESDPVKCKVLGKLAEELGELQSAVARCQIQGVDSLHPVTGKSNRDWITDEVADVYVQLRVLKERMGIDGDGKRMQRKYEMQNLWINQLD